MKYVILGARILLGLLFFVFGLNVLLHFLPMPAMPPSDATTLATILATSKWMTFVGVVQVIGGLLLLVGRYVPLALTLLAPVIVNILLFHLLLSPHGMAPGIIAAVLEVVLLIAYHRSFLPLLAANPEVDPRPL